MLIKLKDRILNYFCSSLVTLVTATPTTVYHQCVILVANRSAIRHGKHHGGREVSPNSCWVTMQKGFLRFTVLALVLALLLEAGCVEPGGSQNRKERTLSEEESQRIALEYLRSSPTFAFDGIEDTLKLVSTMAQQRPYSWQFEYEFKCRHAGYGDRSGKILAQVITSHRAQILVEQGEVSRAVLDDSWDMLKQQFTNGA
jgi:hypothetical protein